MYFDERALDRHITGNYGEDQNSDIEEEDICEQLELEIKRLFGTLANFESSCQFSLKKNPQAYPRVRNLLK